MGNAASRFMIAAPKSGEGKTTVTIALLSALKARGQRPACFKSGPDYIDPMFHQRAMGVEGGNLDLFLSDEETVRRLLLIGAKDADITMIEGAMGYYDGIAMTSKASCHQLAAVTETPVVLTLSANGAALSLASVIKGICDFRGNSGIAGVILNNCRPALFERLAPVLEKETGRPVLGFLPPMPEAALQSRHLGLVTAAETADIDKKLRLLGEAAEMYIDIDRLIALAASAPPLKGADLETAASAPMVTVAVARDEAFCFCYEQTLTTLRSLGADIAEFSPLRGGALPEVASALYLCGGYPELYAEALSKNAGMLQSIRSAIEGGMPCIAECGGFLYLHERLFDDKDIPYPMAGVIKGEARRGKGLSNFGYVTMTARRDNLLCRAGEQLRAHEFHYWSSDCPGGDFYAAKADGRGWDCVFANESLYAGFPHLYPAGDITAARRFIEAARKYAGRRDLK